MNKDNYLELYNEERNELRFEIKNILFYNTPLIINPKYYPARLIINGNKTYRKVISKILVQNVFLYLIQKTLFNNKILA